MNKLLLISALLTVGMSNATERNYQIGHKDSSRGEIIYEDGYQVFYEDASCNMLPPTYQEKVIMRTILRLISFITIGVINSIEDCDATEDCDDSLHGEVIYKDDNVTCYKDGTYTLVKQELTKKS